MATSQDGLEKMVDALRQALRGAEEQNTRMQDRSDVAALCFFVWGDCDS